MEVFSKWLTQSTFNQGKQGWVKHNNNSKHTDERVFSTAYSTQLGLAVAQYNTDYQDTASHQEQAFEGSHLDYWVTLVDRLWNVGACQRFHEVNILIVSN